MENNYTQKRLKTKKSIVKLIYEALYTDLQPRTVGVIFI